MLSFLAFSSIFFCKFYCFGRVYILLSSVSDAMIGVFATEDEILGLLSSIKPEGMGDNDWTVLCGEYFFSGPWDDVYRYGVVSQWMVNRTS